MSRVHVAPSATANGELGDDDDEGYGAPPLSVVPSVQLRLQLTSLGHDPLEQVIAEEIVGAGGENGGDGSGKGPGEGGFEGGGGPLAVSYGSQSPHFAQCPGKYWLSLSQVRVQIEEAWDVKHRGCSTPSGVSGRSAACEKAAKARRASA